MRKTEIRVEPVEEFFERGRKLAHLADYGRRIPPSRVVAFDDIESLLQVLTTKRVLLLKQVRSRCPVMGSRSGLPPSRATFI